MPCNPIRRVQSLVPPCVAISLLVNSLVWKLPEHICQTIHWCGHQSCHGLKWWSARCRWVAPAGHEGLRASKALGYALAVGSVEGLLESGQVFFLLPLICFE